MDYAPGDVVVEEVEKNQPNVRGFMVSLRDGKAICLTEAQNLMQGVRVMVGAVQPADTLTRHIIAIDDVRSAEIDHISPCMVNVELNGDSGDAVWGTIESRVKQVIHDHLFPSRHWYKPSTWFS